MGDELRRLTPWLRLDVSVLTDAKLRRARARGIWPLLLLVMKQGGGVIATEDLDPELLAQDLDGVLDAAGVADRLDALKREGLLVHGTFTVKIGRGSREVDGWTTPNWRNFQPDERSRRGGHVGPQPVERRRPAPSAPRAAAAPQRDLEQAMQRVDAVAVAADPLADPAAFGPEWAGLDADVRRAVMDVWKRIPDVMATDGLVRLHSDFGPQTMTEALRRMREDNWTNPRPSDVRRKCEEIQRSVRGRGAQQPANGRLQGRPMAMTPARPR